MRKIILLVAFLVAAIGYSQQETSWSSWVENNPDKVMQQNEPVKVLQVSPILRGMNTPLADMDSSNRVQQKNESINVVTVSPIISGEDSPQYLEEEELLANLNRDRSEGIYPINAPLNIDALLERYYNIENATGSISDYFNEEELQILRRHFSNLNRAPMADIIPTAGATETFIPNVGDNFFDPGGPGGSCTDGDPGNYPNCDCDTITTLDGVTEINFLDLCLWGNWDFLIVYDSADTSGPVIYDSTSGNGNGTDIDITNMIANSGSTSFTGTSGAMTFFFHASGVVNRTGWDVEITAAGGGGGGGGPSTVWAKDVGFCTSGDFGSFSVDGPYDLAVINNTPTAIFAGDLDDNGVLFGLDNDTLSLLTIDQGTGAETVVGPLTGLVPGHTVSGLAWNEADGTMYASSTDGAETYIYTIDTSTGTMTPLGDTGNSLGIWLAIDNSGNAFMADIGDDNLYSISLIDGTGTLVGPLGIDIGFAQDADFDPDTDILYMAAYIGGGVNQFASVDTATGAATPLGTVNADCAEIGIVAIEGSGGGGGGGGDCTVGTYTDEGSFDAEVAGGSIVMEDFSGGPAPGTGVMACGVGPMSSAGNGCYAPGVLEEGFEIEAQDGGGGLETVWLETGFLGNTVDLVGPNSFVDFMSLTFTGPDDVVAVSMQLLNNLDPDTDFRVFDTGGVLMDTYTLNNPIGSQNFFAVITDVAIGHIEIEGLNGSGELLGNLEFGSCTGGGGGGPATAYCVENALANFSSFDPTDGSVTTPIAVSPAVDFEGAGAVDPNDPTTGYAMDVGGALYSVDIATGAYTLLGTVNQPGAETASGLEFDPVSGTLYLLTTDIFTSTLSTVDIGGLSTTPVGATGMAGGIGLAIDGAGNGWAYDIVDDNFYSVDLGTGAGALVGSIGFDANFGQGMCWDPNTDTVYMSAFNSGLFDSEWRSVDTGTGATTLINQMDAGALTQYAWVSIPGTGGGGGDNDDCADAYVIDCGDTLSGDTSDNTDTNGDGSPDEWFAFTSTTVGELVTVSTCDQAAYDTILTVYDSCGGAVVAVNDDGPGCSGFTSELSFVADGSSTYYIAVDGFGGASGAFDLSVTCSAVANDLCENAIAVDCGESVSGTTINATIDDAVAPTCDTGVTSPGVWYAFTDSSGLVSDVTITMCSGNGTADYDSKLSVYTGDCGAPPLTCVVGNDDTCVLQSEVSFQSDGSTTYLILVHGFGGATGDFTIDINCTPIPPPNDDIVNAIDVVDCDFTDEDVAMPAATTEGGNPVDCDISGANGVWYKFTPDNDGSMTCTIDQPAGTSSVTFYTAPDDNASEGDLVLVDYFDNQCVPGTTTTIPTVVGQWYYTFVVNTGGITDIVFECDLLLGTDDNQIAGFSYYPNPADETINLSALDNIDDVVLYNILGQEVIDLSVDAVSTQINVSNLSTGTYIMKVTVGDQIGTYKVLKR